MKFFNWKTWATGIVSLALLATLGSPTAFAGPFIFSGTDSDDHGDTFLGANVDGWLFMQKALENLAPGVTNANMVVTVLGSTSSALTAASSAFNLSSLAGPGGWTLQTIGTGDFATFFGAGGGIGNAGILMMDSGTNVGGGVDGSAFVPFAATINTFVGDGGGLFSQGNGYDWVSTLLPTLATTDFGGGGIDTALSLSAAGNAAFPGLTNGDLSTGPWHNSFSNTGGLPILATAPQGNSIENVIIGSGTGSITDPGPITPPPPSTNPVPEPGTVLLFGTGLAGLAAWRMRKANKA